MENLDFYKDGAPPSQQTLHQLYDVIDSITTIGVASDGPRFYLSEGIKSKLIFRGGNLIHISQRTDANDDVPLVSILVIQKNKVHCEYQLNQHNYIMSVDRYSTLYPLKSNGPISNPLKLERYLGLTRTTELEIQTLITIFDEINNP